MTNFNSFSINQRKLSDTEQPVHMKLRGRHAIERHQSEDPTTFFQYR